MSENCLHIIHQSISIDSLLYYLFSCKPCNSSSLHVGGPLILAGCISCGAFYMKGPWLVPLQAVSWEPTGTGTGLWQWLEILGSWKPCPRDHSLIGCFQCRFDQNEDISHIYTSWYFFLRNSHPVPCALILPAPPQYTPFNSFSSLNRGTKRRMRLTMGPVHFRPGVIRGPLETTDEFIWFPFQSPRWRGACSPGVGSAGILEGTRTVVRCIRNNDLILRNTLLYAEENQRFIRGTKTTQVLNVSLNPLHRFQSMG